MICVNPLHHPRTGNAVLRRHCLEWGVTQAGCTVAIWNAEWASPRSPRGTRLREVLTAKRADIVVLTEGCEGNLPDGGFVMTSSGDYGYDKAAKSRRKVLLWSREPWVDADAIGSPELPPGRFIQAATQTPIGRLHVIGMCIPFGMAHVSSGQRNRKPWQDHASYLRALADLLAGLPKVRTIIAGDWNQGVPRLTQPYEMFDLLETAFRDWSIATQGPLLETRQSIDHLAHSADLTATSVTAWSNHDPELGRLTDHFGIQVHLTA